MSSTCGHDGVMNVARYLRTDNPVTALRKAPTAGMTEHEHRLAILRAYRQAAGSDATRGGACALLRLLHDETQQPALSCVTTGRAWEQALKDPSLAPPRRAAREHYAAPLECLPPPLGDFVRTVAGFAQAAPELVLFAALAAVSFVTGGRLVIDLRGHCEALTLWVACLALPSERKSGAMVGAATSPLAIAVRCYWDNRAPEQERIEHELDICEAQIKRIKQALSAATVANREELEVGLTNALELRTVLQDRVIPRPVWSVTDATVEGLETVMATSGGVAASFADEAALLSTIAGRYTRGAVSLGSLNSAWSRGSILVQRASTTRQVDEPHLVLCQLVQPAPFEKLMSALRGEADGFLSRWLYADPAPYGRREPRGAALDRSTLDAWRKVLHSLLERCWGARATTELTLTDAAWPRHDAIFAEVETERLAEQSTNGTYAEWLGKAVNGHILRIAALFEVITDPEAMEISDDALRRAIELYRWLRLEARKAMVATSGEELTSEDEHTLLSWLARQRASDRAAGKTPLEFVTGRDVQRGPRQFRGIDRRADVEAVLMQLEAAGWLSRTDSAGRTDAQTRWQVRPDFEEQWTP